MREQEFFNRELRAIRSILINTQRPLSQAAIDLIKSIDDKEMAAFNAKMKEKNNEG